MTDTPKRFEDWEQVDCNDCTHYWDSSCDGASKGSRIGCNSFLATRKVVIPERLNSLEKSVKLLNRIVAGLVGWNIGWLIGIMLLGRLTQ